MTDLDRGPADAGPGPAPALEVEQLAFAYPDGRQALFGVDLRVEPGERVALLGPNGARRDWALALALPAAALLTLAVALVAR